MRSVWGRSPQIPGWILDAVAAHASQLGRTIISDDLFLLALTELDEATRARRALAAAGVNTAAVLAEIRVAGDRSLPVQPPLQFAPASYTMHGRAEGFAVALGDGRITPEHILLAVLWDPMSHSSQLLWRLGVSRERIVDRLRELGVPVPGAPLPHQSEVEYGERVWFARDDVRRVLDHLRLHIPPGTQWRFNYEGDRAWARAEASVDLPVLVRAALTD
jgi:Clp amino terminal domain, pathogenicity island component